MKTKILSLIGIIVFAVIAQAFTKVGTTKEINTEKSTITWKGYKVTGSHAGTLSFTKGELTFNNDNILIGGNFTVDMMSVICTDLSGDYKTKLENHLKSDDFFGVDKHPTATMVFTSVNTKSKNSYTVTANVTIKDITHPVTFNLSIYGNQANANVKIDRSKYNIRYGSGSFFDNLGDKTIFDEFDLIVDLFF